MQLLQVLNFHRGKRTQAILNRFNQLSLDFLNLNPDTSIIAAVELDDITHAREASRQADARKDHALKSAGPFEARELADVQSSILRGCLRS